MGEITLVSIQVGMPRQWGDDSSSELMEQPWTSAIFKDPVKGRIRLSQTNLDGDLQADSANHGGVHKAVLAYSADHYPQWRVALSIPDMPFGGFGENFTIAGLAEETVCIGDTFVIGDVRVQVSQPRGPCWKLSRRWRIQDLDAQVEANGHTGWYMRVLKEGFVGAGEVVRLEDRPFPQLTICLAHRIMYRQVVDSATAEAMVICPLLAPAWREKLARRLAR